MRLMVVEDEKNMAGLLKAGLEEEKHRVTLAFDGTTALELAGIYEFDVIVLDVMLPYYLHYQVFQMILDARASEHSARMVAMKNATDNAKQFIKDLTLEYNKMRQASITTELLEISTAQMAVGA